MEKNLVKESFLYIDDVEVYTASPYSKYEAPQTLSLKSGATYSGKMGGLVNAMLDITSSSTANLLIPSKREMSSGTYSIVNDEVTFSFIGGAVEYKAKISKDLNKLSFISSNTDNAIGAALQNCNFDRMDIVEDSDYESAGKMFYQNSDAASRSGARGAYYCDYYNNNENNSSPVGGKKWILMGGGGDQLDLDESDSFVGTKSLKMKSSTAGAMRYLQWGLYDGTSVAHRGYNSFSVFMKNPNNFDVKVKIVVYKIYKVAPSTQDYKVTKEVTVPANSDWTQYTAPLDANTSYYGYGIICVQNSSTGYINVDCAYFHNDYDDPLLTYFAKQDLTLTGAVNSGNATIKFGAKTQVYLTCAAANFTNKACTYSWKINDLGDQILTIKINDSTFIQGKYTVDDTGKAKFEVTSAVSADGSLGQLISNGATFVS